MKRALGTLLLAACASHPSPPTTTGGAEDAATNAPVSALVGEVHLHEFPQGGHAWAAFVHDPVPLADVRGGSMTEIDPEPEELAGACALYVVPACGACGASFRIVRAGAIAVTGSALVPMIRLWPLDDGAYVADPPPGAQRLFAGGESLAFRGGEGDGAFVAELPAPGPVDVVAPNLALDLRVPLSGAMDVRWSPPPSDEVVVRVIASTMSTSAWIRCDTAGATGISVPAELLAKLPPPPRSTRLEVERVEQRIAPTARAGLGILVHAAQTTWKNGSD